MTRSRRALLYVPGDDQHKVEKALTLDGDCICLDLEDGVALNRKGEARRAVAQALGSANFGRAERLARINPIGSGLESDDLAAILPARPDGIVVPKVDSALQVQWVSRQIAGWDTASPLRLMILIESARAVLNLREIAESDERLDALIFGAEDLAADIGATRTHAGSEVFYARSAVVLHAAACGLQAIDMVCVEFNDTQSLYREAREGAQMGYSGKQAIHPQQIGPIQRAFTPSAEEIARARRIIEAHAAHQAAGAGAFALDGKMVDMPVVKAAERVLARWAGS